MTDTPIEKLTRVYIKMRDAKAKLAAEFKEKEGSLNAQMDQVKAALLDYCKEHEVESVRTTSGLVYRSKKTRYWTSDWEAMHRFVVENNVPEFLEKRLNQTVVKTFLEENPETVPPGINADSEYTITVRKA
jgi:alpha-galactosidase/6-phospho-beta-glucosidase family protein